MDLWEPVSLRVFHAWWLCLLLGVSVATCMAILQVGSCLQLRTASTGSKEEDYENDAATIVQKCVSVTNVPHDSQYVPHNNVWLK